MKMYFLNGNEVDGVIKKKILKFDLAIKCEGPGDHNTNFLMVHILPIHV